MLVGDVLPLKNEVVWRNLVKLADRGEGENLVIAAAHNRPKLYGSFTLRAYQRYGSTAELIPLAEEFQEFSTDYKIRSQDQDLADKVRDAGSIFFVGGEPQRLSKVLFDKNGHITPLAAAIQQNHQSGNFIIGGVPASMAVATDTNAFEVLAQGEISPHHLIPGLALLERDWFVDQHVFGNGRLATALVAMHQLNMTYGIGVGLDTAAVIHGSTVEVLGNRGIVVIDLSDASFDRRKSGVVVQGVRLTYLENGDRIQMDTMQTTPYHKKANDFELLPKINARTNPVQDAFIASQNVLLPEKSCASCMMHWNPTPASPKGLLGWMKTPEKDLFFAFIPVQTAEDGFLLQREKIDLPCRIFIWISPR